MAIVADFTAGKVERGRITNYRTTEFLEFTYNPHTIHSKGGSNLAEDAIPGFSDPLIRWASGKTKTISFSLELSGEGTLRRSGVPFRNYAEGQSDEIDSFSVNGEIAFLQSFTYPTDPALPGGSAAPDLLIFRFGPRYPGVLCVMESADDEIIEWSPKLEPVRAKVQITLKRIQNTNQYANTIWQGDR